MPKSIDGMPEASFQTFSLLTFVYPTTFIELCQYLVTLTSISNVKRVPEMLIFDDLDHFIDSYTKLTKGIWCKKKDEAEKY